MITENVSTLEIHKLRKSQYDRLVESGQVNEQALYLVPDEAGEGVSQSGVNVYEAEVINSRFVIKTNGKFDVTTSNTIKFYMKEIKSYDFRIGIWIQNEDGTETNLTGSNYLYVLDSTKVIYGMGEGYSDLVANQVYEIFFAPNPYDTSSYKPYLTDYSYCISFTLPSNINTDSGEVNISLNSGNYNDIKKAHEGGKKVYAKMSHTSGDFQTNLNLTSFEYDHEGGGGVAIFSGDYQYGAKNIVLKVFSYGSATAQAVETNTSLTQGVATAFNTLSDYERKFAAMGQIVNYGSSLAGGGFYLWITGNIDYNMYVGEISKGTYRHRLKFYNPSQNALDALLFATDVDIEIPSTSVSIGYLYQSDRNPIQYKGDGYVYIDIISSMQSIPYFSGTCALEGYNFNFI